MLPSASSLTGKEVFRREARLLRRCTAERDDDEEGSSSNSMALLAPLYCCDGRLLDVRKTSGPGLSSVFLKESTKIRSTGGQKAGCRQ
jgi:hypothetical protein